MIFDIEQQSCIDYVTSFTNGNKFMKDFKKSYQYIRAYHATNMDEAEIRDLKTNGLRPGTSGLLMEKAINRFVNVTDSAELQIEIKNVISNFFTQDSRHFTSEINFGLVRQPFIDEWYHYLLFGPESLFPLADLLKQKYNINFRSKMIEFGSHYIIKATIPVVHVNPKWINVIYDYINYDFPEASLVYHKVLPADSLFIELVQRPKDPKGFEYM